MPPPSMRPTRHRMETIVAKEYALRVRGRLSPDIIAALHPLRPTEPVTETVLRGDLADEAALHGIIARLEQLGVELVELLRLPGDADFESPRPSRG
jgi:hypothetical protein